MPATGKRKEDQARRHRGPSPAESRGDADAGFLVRPAVPADRQHAGLLAARRGHDASGHRLPVVGRAGLLGQIPLGAADRSRGRPDLRPLRPSARLDDRQPAARRRGIAGALCRRPEGRARRSSASLRCIVAFASSTQDIVVDAWRIEAASDSDELGLLSAAYQLGYRGALLVTDSLILISASRLGWPISYSMMAVLMARRPVRELRRDRAAAGRRSWRDRGTRGRAASGGGFIDAVIGPFAEFFRVYGWLALLMLAMISFYRLPEFMMGPMANPFYHDLGPLQGRRRRGSCVDRPAGVAARDRRWRLQRAALWLLPDADRRRDPAERRHCGVRAAGLSRSRPADVWRRHGGRQLRRQLRRRRAGHLHVEPDQPRLHGDAVRAPQLRLHVRRQVREGLFGSASSSISRPDGRCIEGYALFFIGAGLFGIPALVLCLLLSRANRGDRTAGPRGPVRRPKL